MSRYFNSLLRISGLEKFRAAGVLLSGTLLGQLVALAALPILTRLYSPMEFADFAVFAAIFGVLAPIACLRFEIAIPLPKEDSDAVGLVVASILSAVCFSLLIFFILIFFNQYFKVALENISIEQLLFLVPVGVMLSGIFAAFQYWATRKGAFVVIAKSRLSQAVGGAVVQLGFGFLHFGVLGLVLGYLVSCSAGILLLFRRVISQDLQLLNAVSLPTVKATLAKYINFPKYSVVESLANNAGIQLPLILLSVLVVGAEVGYLMLVTRVLQAPLSLVGGSLAQVFLSNAASEYRKGSIGNYSIGVVESVMKIAVGPLLFTACVAPQVFGFVFGPEWEIAGVYASWMVPWAIMQLLVYPIGMVFHVVGKQSTALKLQVGGLVFRIIGLVLVVSLHKGYAVQAYAVTAFLFYFAYLFVALRIACVSWLMFLSVVKRCFWIICAWLATGALARSLLIVID